MQKLLTVKVLNKIHKCLRESIRVITITIFIFDTFLGILIVTLSNVTTIFLNLTKLAVTITERSIKNKICYY